jgi:hypothetical protein
MRCATVYQRKGDLLLHAMSMTTDGLWILTEPVVRLATDVEDEVLGRAVRAVLEHSRSGVSHPTDFRAVTEPLLRAAGVKSSSTFAKSSVSVEVAETESRVLELVPMENKGPADGFVPRADKQTVRGESDSELGKAVRLAISLAS